MWAFPLLPQVHETRKSWNSEQFASPPDFMRLYIHTYMHMPNKKEVLLIA